MSKQNIQKLIKLAEEAQQNAYAPYSRYRVGALVVDENGTYYSGCNVENACYPAGICAERTAIAKMVSAGGKKIRELVVVTDSKAPVFPCGMCLQVISEFGLGSEIIAVGKDRKKFHVQKFEELFPKVFSKNELKK